MESLQLDNTSLDAIYMAPARGQPLCVLGHGAGAPMTHAHISAIAEALAEVGIGTLRFNFPFMQSGKRRVDAKPVCLETFSHAIATAQRLNPSARLLLGGHSFGGRMATHYLAEEQPSMTGGVFFSFPLHASKKPDTQRAAHLPEIEIPLLFVSGDRDTLAEKDLLTNVTAGLPKATLHWIDTADHSFKILKRTRESSEDVYSEAARVTASWLVSVT